MQVQLSSAQTRGHLQAIRKRTVSGAGVPVNHNIAMSLSLRCQPCPSVGSGRSSVF